MSLLIKGGCVLTFNADKSVSFPVKDILLDGNPLTQIADKIEFTGETIDAPGSSTLIDIFRNRICEPQQGIYR
jgi:hypothetical protein